MLKDKSVFLFQLINKACFLVSFIFFIPMAKGQDPELVDSLIKVYNVNNLKDSAKLNILWDISFNHPIQDQRIKYANKLIKTAREKESLIFEYRGLLQKGYAFRTKGDLEIAAQCFYKAIGIASKINYKKGIGSAYIALGDVYSINKNFNSSSIFYQKAISIFKDEGDSVNLATALMNYGDDFYQNNLLDSALSNFSSSLEIYQSLDYHLGIGYNLGNIGLVHAKKGNYYLAEKNLNKATSILEKLAAYYPIAVYYLSMSDIYLYEKDFKKALDYVYKSLELATQHGLKEQIRDASLKLSEIYAQTEDYQKAYEFHTQYVTYRDSINNKEVISKMADMRTEYEVSQKQAEIDLLTKQRQINQLIGLALLFILLLLAVLAFLLYRNNRLKQSANKELSRQKSELEIQHQKLEALNNTKDRFFSIISHDLRGPVNAFNGISELIKHYIAKNEMGQLREVSEYIDKSARQLSGLLDNLLDWAIKQQGAFPFKAEKIHLNPVLRELVDMFSITAHGKNITLTLDVEEEIEVWADRNSLLTIVRNLLNNALKFTEKSGLVSINAYTEKGYAHINVIDTGIGMTEEMLERIFELQEKSASQGTSGEKGLGIGLNLAYEFALMNEGTIMANSEVNAGTIFTLKVPVYHTSKLLSAPAQAISE